MEKSYLTILNKFTKSKKSFCKCQCVCGTIKVFRLDHVNSGHTLSCGCYHKKVFTAKTHGHTVNGKLSPEYCAWSGMWARCTNKKHGSFANYGARGIKICDRWKAFVDFLLDMGERPGAQYSLDRIDNSGNYEPKNCKWSTRSEQMLNTRNRAGKTSKYRYVSYDKENKKWRVVVTKYGESKRLGRFRTEKEAKQVVDKYIKEVESGKE